MNKNLERTLNFIKQHENDGKYFDELVKNNLINIKSTPKRKIGHGAWLTIKDDYKNHRTKPLIKHLIQYAPRFPISGGAISYLRKIPSAWHSKALVNGVGHQLYSLSLKDIYNQSSKSKSNSRQDASIFKNFVGSLTNNHYITQTDNVNTFIHSKQPNMLLNTTSDKPMQQFAKKYLGYNRTDDKGLDIVGRIGHTYFFGEDKVITEQGGGQIDQLKDSLRTAKVNPNPSKNAKKLAIQPHKIVPMSILDGCVFDRCLHHNDHIRQYIMQNQNKCIMSALTLPKFFYHLTQTREYQRDFGKKVKIQLPKRKFKQHHQHYGFRTRPIPLNHRKPNHHPHHSYDPTLK